MFRARLTGAPRTLDAAADVLGKGRLDLIYAEGGPPRRRDAAEAAPGTFRSGLARLDGVYATLSFPGRAELRAGSDFAASAPDGEQHC